MWESNCEGKPVGISLGTNDPSCIVSYVTLLLYKYKMVFSQYHPRKVAHKFYRKTDYKPITIRPAIATDNSEPQLLLRKSRPAYHLATQ